MNDKLIKQIEFIKEIDKVKSIMRKTQLFHTDRYENDAEHSWHICMMAIVFVEYADEEVDLLKVLKMLLIHDLVEIDTGDIIVYDKTKEDVLEEVKAAKRIFGLLPKGYGDEYFELWNEFEERKTPEARYAGALDRMEPIMQNLHREGVNWEKHKITYETVIGLNKRIGDGSTKLWEYIKEEIDECNKKGAFYLGEE